MLQFADASTIHSVVSCAQAAVGGVEVLSGSAVVPLIFCRRSQEGANARIRVSVQISNKVFANFLKF